jgi:hypothetical protein
LNPSRSGIPKLACAAAILVLAAGGLAGAQENGRLAVDVELVIAVDVSRSMDAEEFRVQRSGYVDAIGDPEFIRAATLGPHGRIALTYVEWSSRLTQEVVVPWRLIDGKAAAEAFAALLDAEPIEIGRGTSISAAIAFASAHFEANEFEGERRVIDISGDGPNNYGPPVVKERDAAIAAGIVINGLPILIRPSPIVPDIVRYYTDCVIGGPSAFVLPVREVGEFAEAIRQKLVLEVAGEAPARILFAQAKPPTDCLAGEKAREGLTDRYFPGLDN